MSRPFWLSEFIVDYPFHITCFSTIFLSGLLFLTVYFGLFKQSDQNLRDYLVWNDPITFDYDKKVVSETAINRMMSSKDGHIDERGVNINDWNSILLYQSNDTNLWTAEKLREIQKIEQSIFDLPEYQKVCPPG